MVSSAPLILFLLAPLSLLALLPPLDVCSDKVSSVKYMFKFNDELELVIRLKPPPDRCEIIEFLREHEDDRLFDPNTAGGSIV